MISREAVGASPSPLFQQILGLDALQTGMIILSSMLLSGVMGPVGGGLSDKVNPRIPVLMGFAGMAGLFYAMSYANAFTTVLTMTLMIAIRVALNLIHTPSHPHGHGGVAHQRIARGASMYPLCPLALWEKVGVREAPELDDA